MKMQRMIQLRTKTRFTFLLTLIGWLVLAPVSSPLRAQSRIINQTGRLAYTGNIIYIGGYRGTTATNFTVRINSFTPAAQVESILAALRDGGQERLRSAIDKEKRGTIQIGTQLARDINAAPSGARLSLSC